MNASLRIGSRALVAVAVASLGLLPSSGGAAAGEGDSTAGDRGAPLVAFCSIPPQSYLIERIGGGFVSVNVMVGAGQSPHTFEPTPKQMATLADADVYFGIGLPFEDRIMSGVEELSTRLVVVDASDGIPKRHVEGTRCDDHEHGDHGHEDEDGLPDPHVWLNPRFAGVIARNTCDALKELSPESTDILDGNLAALLGDLEELDSELSEVLGPLTGESVYVFHPAFGYFTDAYGLTQVAVEVGGMEPSARELVRLTRQATDDGVRIIFVQPQFSSRSAAAIAAEIGGAVVAIDPLSSDYLENLKGIARAIGGALAGDAPEEQEEH